MITTLATLHGGGSERWIWRAVQRPLKWLTAEFPNPGGSAPLAILHALRAANKSPAQPRSPPRNVTSIRCLNLAQCRGTDRIGCWTGSLECSGGLIPDLSVLPPWRRFHPPPPPHPPPPRKAWDLRSAGESKSRPRVVVQGSQAINAGVTTATAVWNPCTISPNSRWRCDNGAAGGGNDIFTGTVSFVLEVKMAVAVRKSGEAHGGTTFAFLSAAMAYSKELSDSDAAKDLSSRRRLASRLVRRSVGFETATHRRRATYGPEAGSVYQGSRPSNVEWKAES